MGGGVLTQRSSKISSSGLEKILRSLLDSTTLVCDGPACVLKLLVSWRTSAAVAGPNNLRNISGIL